jgi:ribosomal protein S18 acetylase RimI-like enzyme
MAGIRKAERRDFKAVKTLFEDNGQLYPIGKSDRDSLFDETYFKTLLRGRERHMCFVVERGGEVVAAMTLDFGMRAGKPTGHMDRIVVRADSRHIGIATQLVATAKQALMERGILIVRTELNKENVASHGLLLRTGFAISSGPTFLDSASCRMDLLNGMPGRQ